MVYWQQGDDVINDVFGAKIGPAGTGFATWSSPMRLTTPFKVFLFDKHPQSTPIAQFDVDSLGAGAFVDVTFPWTVPATGGKHVLRVVADGTNVIAETTESNNEAVAVVESIAEIHFRTLRPTF